MKNLLIPCVNKDDSESMMDLVLNYYQIRKNAYTLMDILPKTVTSAVGKEIAMMVFQFKKAPYLFSKYEIERVLKSIPVGEEILLNFLKGYYIKKLFRFTFYPKTEDEEITFRQIIHGKEDLERLFNYPLVGVRKTGGIPDCFYIYLEKEEFIEKIYYFWIMYYIDRILHYFPNRVSCDTSNFMMNDCNIMSISQKDKLVIFGNFRLHKCMFALYYSEGMWKIRESNEEENKKVHTNMLRSITLNRKKFGLEEELVKKGGTL